MDTIAKVDISHLIHACIMMMIIVDVSQAQGITSNGLAQCVIVYITDVNFRANATAVLGVTRY